MKKKQQAILRVLKETEKPLTSGRIGEELDELGHEISQRTIRLYLQKMDEEGLTRNIGKRGRVITEKGLGELEVYRIIDRVGFLSAKIDQMTYRMDFNLSTRTGTVVINVTLVEPNQLKDCLPMIGKVYQDGYAMGQLAVFIEPGERIGYTTVPEGMIGIGTVCSVTLNGVLLHHGIPVASRFGGLLELQNRKATRFVEIIMYEGTSIDPLEVFIRSGMTNYLGAITDGNGRIGAGFREVPAESRDRVVDLARKLDRIGLGGFLQVGRPGRALLDIPVNEGMAGAIVIGGLNPVAILEETGVRVHSRALAGLIDFDRLFHYDELLNRITKYC